ncbi:uncharacterized protein [Ptychodera flava]|uniref:uncharacterized protein n=1 Tax=Ptychodera flava TaxID=63121 RepID=UPI00396A6E04
MSGKKKIYVRHARVEGNLLPLQCLESDTVHELAQAVKDNAELFDLKSDDIRINKIRLFLRDDKGESRKLEFFEPISVIQKNYTVEFNEEQELTFGIPVRYIKSVNPIRIPYRERNVVSDLAGYIQDNISAFRLAEEVTERAQQAGSEVVLMQRVEGKETELNPNTTVRSLEGSDVAFKIKSSKKLLNTPTDPDAGIEVFIKHRTTVHPIRFQCSEEDKISDLPGKIKERIADFNLTDDDVKEVEKKGNEIILMTIASKPGDVCRVLNTSDKVIDIDPRRFEFSVQTKQMRIITLDDIKEKCDDVNIAFIGAPGHGKSSTINTIIKALSRLHTPLASTWKGAATGTAALTTYKIDVKGKSFTCIDVPGSALKKCENEGGKDRSSKVIADIFDGKYPENERLDYWAWYSPKAWAKTLTSSAGVVHAVAYVHKGTAEPDKLGNTVIEVAQRKGRGIPVFAIITHVDKMSAEDVDKAVESISHTMGIDDARIFRVANFDHKQKVAETRCTSEEDVYVQRVLLGLLSAGENYRQDGHVSIE